MREIIAFHPTLSTVPPGNQVATWEKFALLGRLASTSEDLPSLFAELVVSC